MSNTSLSTALSIGCELFCNFYTTHIEDNGKLEKWANGCLNPLRVLLTLGGRRVTHLTDKSYHLEGEKSWLPGKIFSGSDPITLGAACIAGVVTVAGTILKAISWIIYPETFHRNLQFVHLRRSERAKAQKLVRQEDLFVKKQINTDTDLAKNDHLSRLPPELLENIHHHLGEKNLGHLRLVSSWHHLCATHSWYKLHGQKQREHIQVLFSQNLFRVVDIDKWCRLPRMKLLAHKTCAEPGNFEIQEYNGTAPALAPFIQVKEMGEASLRWGKDPIPFLAIRVHYQAITRLSSWGHWLSRGYCELKTEERATVITLYPKTRNRDLFLHAIQQAQNELRRFNHQRLTTQPMPDDEALPILREAALLPYPCHPDQPWAIAVPDCEPRRLKPEDIDKLAELFQSNAPVAFEGFPNAFTYREESSRPS